MRSQTNLIGLTVMSAVLTMSGGFAASADETGPPLSKEEQFAGGPTDAILVGGNGIYTIRFEDSGGDCGTWTAGTGALHPAGPGSDVLFGNTNPGTSYTTLRSYSSGIDYVTEDNCTALCTADPAFTNTPIMNGATVVGWTTVWTFADSGTTVRFTQEVEVVGPVDGTETVDDTVIRETHTVENLGGASIEYGLRKMWDWRIEFDDGPHFGDCDTPDTACDRSMNLTADGSEDGLYPDAYVINEDPAFVACPSGAPVGPDCGGAPIYLVGATVTPSSLSPPPDAPELLQYNNWGVLFSDCWEPALFDSATCGGGDTALAYFYGRTAASALTLAPGASRSFTQYVVAGVDACPDVIIPPDDPAEIPTVSEWGLIVLALMLLTGGTIVLRREMTRRPTVA